MRRLILTTSLVILAAWSATGCKRQPSARVETIEEEGPSLAIMIHVADPRASVQLLKGFHEVEQNAWRWTMGRFSVTLRPPAGAAEKGARLHLKFSIPDPVILQLKSVSLSANVGGASIPSQTYTKPGEYTYSQDVPPSVLSGDAVTVDFALDKFLAPGAVDQRELGVVVSTVGFEAK